MVYGYPAILLPLNLHARCFISDFQKEKNKKGIVQISALGEEAEFDWQDKTLKNIKFSLVATALEVSFDFFKIKERPSFKLKIESEIPIGGFGSSTAVSAAIVKSVAKMLNKSIPPKDLWKLLVKIETKNGTKVSGADQYVISHESLIKYKKYSAVRKLKIRSKILKRFLIINSGAPSCTTGECVGFVAQEKKSFPKKVDNIFRQIASESEKMLDYLKKNNIHGFFRTIKSSGELLISLGVVSSDSVNLIRKLEKLGGYLKLTGAGTINKGGSGGILCFARSYKKIKTYLSKNNVKFFEVSV